MPNIGLFHFVVIGPMKYFPIFLDSQRLQCLVVGAGEVAARKIELLLKSDANVTVVAPEVCSTVSTLAAQHPIQLIQREFQCSDLNEKNLVFVATDKQALNQEISALAQTKNIFVNVVDNTPHCTFITPSIVDRSPITIALSSGGVAPVLLRYLRQKLESVIPANISKLGQFAEKFRDTVKSNLKTVDQRRLFWESVFEGDIAEDVVQQNQHKAEKKFNQLLLQEANNEHINGEVYLIGAGPGDPDLLTFRALRLMQKADVVVYDRLVSPEILELVRRDAEKIYAGKEKSNHTLPQEDINLLMVRKAKQGQRVVRLKGGDPFIFGRGGEEIETLVDHQIQFQVVPGITAASGASTYGGIPLTHRDHAQSVTFATGHLKDGTIDLDWAALSQQNQTLVVYMGLGGLDIIANQLIAHGMQPTMPVAVIQSATLENQKVVTGSLKTIKGKVEENNIVSPALIIIGTVVTLHKTLQWR